MMRPLLAAGIALLSACDAHQPVPQAPDTGRNTSPRPVWPGYPPGFDPTKPGVQSGCYEDGHCWILVVEGPGFGPGIGGGE